MSQISFGTWVTKNLFVLVCHEWTTISHDDADLTPWVNDLFDLHSLENSSDQRHQFDGQSRWAVAYPFACVLACVFLCLRALNNDGGADVITSMLMVFFFDCRVAAFNPPAVFISPDQ